ncbi:MAG: hypothetical protein HRT61_05645, partial [Ekhidna sp.]|nr:hypothetical protein [Ekhidna sp.]
MKFIRTIICVGLFLTGTLAYSQSSEYDQVLVLVGEADSTLYDNPERSLDLAEEANALAKSLKNDSLIALTLNRMGSAQWSLGNEIKALENIQASLQLAEASKLEAIVAKNLGNIGNIYAASGLDLDAIGYYKSELELQKNLGNKFRLFAVNNNIGKSFLDLRMYDSARNYLNAAGAYLDQSFEQFHSIFFFNHAELNFAVGNYDLADLLLRMTYQNSERFSSKRGLIRANQLRAELDLTLGFPKKALLQAELAFELARESKVKELIYICSKTLSKCFAALGRFEEAYEKEVLHEQYLDSVRSVNTINELELLSYYQRLFKLRVLETKNTTNRELAEKRELIIHELVIALVVAAVLIAVIVLVVRELGIRKRELEKLNSFKAKIFAIVSHDLKSPIQSVSSVIEMFNQKLITKEEIEPFIPEV